MIDLFAGTFSNDKVLITPDSTVQDIIKQADPKYVEPDWASRDSRIIADQINHQRLLGRKVEVVQHKLGKIVFFRPALQVGEHMYISEIDFDMNDMIQEFFLQVCFQEKSSFLDFLFRKKNREYRYAVEYLENSIGDPVKYDDVHVEYRPRWGLIICRQESDKRCDGIRIIFDK